MSGNGGLLLDKRYEILSVVGTGGMATVYKGKDRVLNRLVAIKVLKQEYNSDQDFVEKFDKESQSAASLSHPNIVNIFDVGFDQDMHYIVMELVSGHTLKDYLNKMQGFMRESAAINIVLQTCSALAHAHENNIIHRDIKSQNILVSEAGNIKVADFGIARATTSSTIVNTKEVIGSVHYASPEQARGGFVDCRSDIYSLGILMYELMTKALPFNGDTPVSVALKQLRENLPDPKLINDEISNGYGSIIRKATAKDLNARYQSVAEMMEDLNALLGNKDFMVASTAYVNDETTVLPTLSEDDIMKTKQNSNRRTSNSNRPTSTKKQPVSKLNVTLVVIGALIITLLIFSIIAVNRFKEVFNVEIVTVPSVVGLDVDEAIREIQAVGLIPDTTEYRYTNEIDKDIVISQNYSPGEELKEGFTVKLVVSNGAVQGTVPNVIQQDLTKARVMIENDNFAVGEITYQFDDLPSGTVISQSPKSGLTVDEGTEVDLVVSQGPEIKTVLVPNLSGETLSDAEIELNRLGLKLGSIDYELSDEYEEGMIISNAGVGLSYEQGSEVSVVVSNGPTGEVVDGETTDAETTDGQSTTDGSTSTDTGTDSTSETESEISLAFYTSTFINDPEVIKIVMVKGDVRTTVYEETHTKADGDFRIKVKGSGTAILEIYYSDKMISQRSVQF